jgi:DNA-directed RNA polymerase subunit RPC12/RpoP
MTTQGTRVLLNRHHRDGGEDQERIEMSRPNPHPPGYRAGKYYQSYRCANCGHSQQVSIQKGQPAPAQAYEACDNCGCKALVKVAK